MGEQTAIAWTDHTFNPWWGCQRVSPGCEHCYAETFSRRVGLKVWGPTTERRFFGDEHWAEPIKWNRKAAEEGVRRRVFCASMADVFENRDDLLPHRARLWVLIASTPHLDWLILTKRPQNVEAMARAAASHNWDAEPPHVVTPWPRNVWLGTTAEDQQRADERIPALLGVPAAVRFVSYEPAIGPVDFTRIRNGGKLFAPFNALRRWDPGNGEPTTGIDWVIVGGESGGGARPFDLAWARSAVAQCYGAGIACFVKQLGAFPIDGVAGNVVPQRDRKGGDQDEWPQILRVRQFPRSAA
jgi:protein gp37